MASFQQDVGNPDLPPGATFVKRGVKDDSIAQTIALVGNTAVELDKGRALAELTGDASNANEANKLPDDVNADLNMSQLTAARRAGKISASEYTARLQANQRRLISKFPRYATAIRERGASFFEGALDSRALFSDAAAKENQSPEQKLAEAGALAFERARQGQLGRQQGLAEALNLPLHVVQEMDRNQAIDAFNISAHNADKAQQESTGDSWVKAGQAHLRVVQRGLMAETLRRVNESGGLTPRDINELKFKFTSDMAKVEEEMRSNAPARTDFSNWNQQVADVKASTIELIGMQGFEEIFKSNLSILDNAAGISLIEDAPRFAQLAKYGSGAIEAYTKYISNPSLQSLLKKQDPDFAQMLDTVGTSRLLENTIAKIRSGRPMVQPYERNAAAGMGRVALETPVADPKAAPNAEELLLPQLVGDVPSSLYGWTSPTAQHKVASNEQYRNLMLNTVKSTEAYILTQLAGAGKTSITEEDLNNGGADLPMDQLRGYYAIVKANSQYVTGGVPPDIYMQQQFSKWSSILQGGNKSTGTSPAPSDDGVIELDESGAVVTKTTTQAKPAPSLEGTPLGSALEAGASAEPGAMENIAGAAASATASSATRAAAAYAKMVARGETPSMADVLNEDSFLRGAAAFSFDRKEWTRIFDEALPAGVPKPKWGIRD